MAKLEQRRYKILDIQSIRSDMPYYKESRNKEGRYL